MTARKSIGAAILGSVLAAAGCATAPKAPDTTGLPTFSLESYFPGRSEAWGVFQDRSGTLRRQFKVVIDSTWDGQTLILDERFAYTDGATERRVWRINKTGPNTYEGRADDVIGVARGVVQGNQLSWTYSIRLPVGRNGLVTQFDDRMWLQPDGVLINRAIVRKFGVRVAEATITFQRKDAMAAGLAQAAE
jgi:hypothetical protein